MTKTPPLFCFNLVKLQQQEKQEQNLLSTPLELGPVNAESHGGGGGTPKKIGWGVQPASQNPYSIYDQNLRFPLPYL